jgi:predicted RNA methylase
MVSQQQYIRFFSHEKNIQLKRMVKAKTGLHRENTDKFYTRKHVVEMCHDMIKKYLHINHSKDLIIEPSAGNGSFIEIIQDLCNNYLFIDIDPESEGIIKMDYLDLDPEVLEGLFKRIHIIGNPPFGRQSTTAIKFIKKSCEFCDTISFILPRSFRNATMKKYFPLDFHLVYQINLQKNSFKINDKYHNVCCVFQIWEKRDRQRRPPKKQEPMGFVFCKQSENPDVAVRNTGGAGALSSPNEVVNKNHHYFIKFTNGRSLRRNLMAIGNAKFRTNNTTGVDSISKQMLIKEYNRLLC